MDDLKKFLGEGAAHTILRIVLLLIAAILIFQLGVLAGSRHFRHAAFEYPGGPGMEMYNGMPHLSMVEGHGDVGTVSAIALPAITLTERDGEINQITVASSTQIQEIKNPGSPGPEQEVTIPASDIHTGDFVVAIGQPDQSDTLVAALIRVMPFSSTTSTR